MFYIIIILILSFLDTSFTMFWPEIEIPWLINIPKSSVEIPCPPLPLDICVSVRYNQRWMVGGGWGNDLLQSGIVTAPARQRDSPHSAPGADVTSPGLMMEQWHRHIFSLLFDWSHCQSDFFLCFHALAADDSDYIEDFNDKIGNYISKVAGPEEGTCENLNMQTPPNINANIVK